jgi:hypothetical protein
MKRMLVLLAVLGALAAIVVPISAAANGNGSTVTHLTITPALSYNDPVVGPVNCYRGDNVFKTAPKPVNQDTEDCTILSGAGNAVYNFPNGNYPGWVSDFTTGPSAFKLATSVTITVTPNADGITSNEHIVANYPTTA